MAKGGPGEYLRRYRAGEHEAVWAELTALGPRVRDAAHFDDALAVAQETMRRARANVELIVRRLDHLDYRFWNGKQGKPAGPPNKAALGNMVIEASPVEALLAAMFAAAKKIPPAEFTPQMITQLHNMYRLVMFPWQNRSLLLKGQRFVLDGELTALFEQAKKLPPGQLAAGTVEKLDDLRRRAIEQAIDYWKAKGEDPPAKREADLRLKETADHLKDKRVFCPPGKKEIALARKLEKKGVLLPLSLRAWIEEVGDVNLAGAHRTLCFWDDASPHRVHADPLMVSPRLSLWEAEAWSAERGAGGAPPTFDALLGWDAKAKARLTVEDVELDHGYTVSLPNGAADATLAGAPGGATFVNYLRIAFRNGGFPGWDGHLDRPEKEMALLTDGLQPI